MSNLPFQNLVEMLRTRTRQDPDKVGYIFLADGAGDERRLTYRQLDERAAALAACIQEHAAPGDRVLLLCPPGLEFIEGFFASLYSGAIAVPAFPPDPSALDRMLRRIEAIVRDCDPAVIVTTSEFARARELLAAHSPALGRLPVVSTDSATGGRDLVKTSIGPADPAFLQYTSGSTGSPKGVILSHANLLRNEVMINSAMPQGPDSVLVSWLPLFHDMGLIGIALNTAFLGARCVFMSPQHFLERPARWLEAVTRHRATLTGAPNFGFELCLRKVGPAERARLDLSSLQFMFNGAEPVRADTLDGFASEFAACGLRAEVLTPCYGLAEATLIVSSVSSATRPRSVAFDAAALEAGTAVPAKENGARRLVGVGTPAGAQSIRIVDPESGTPRPTGSVGEIWVAGDHVGQGYWERPDESTEVFTARLHGTDEPYLRTGDLGFWYEGELYVAGRLKDLLIVRGRNLAPQDLERTAELAHPGLRPGCGAAFQVDQDGAGPLLIAVHEFDAAKGGEPQEAIGAIRSAIAGEYDVEPDAVVLIKPRTIPKTSSGKIQRRACRQAFETDGLKVIARWTAARREAERELAARVEAALRARLETACGLPADQAATADGLSGFGVDSLTAAQIRSELQRRFGVSVSLVELLRGHDLTALSRQIATAVQSPPTVLRDSASRFPLSDGQLALWYIHEQQPESAAYNVSAAICIRRPLEVDLLRRAMETLAQRHEALRTRFAQHGGVPFQQVLESRPIDFEVADATAWSEREISDRVAAAVGRPFDLRHDPLMRVKVYRRSDQEHRLLLVVHHIITDFWSLAQFADELGQVYMGLMTGTEPALPPVDGRYADFVRWQSAWLGSREARVQLEELASSLASLPEPLPLPTDRLRPPVQTTHGSSVLRQLGPDLTEHVEQFARRHGVTPYTLLLTVFQSLLHRYTGTTDIIVGSPAAGRERPEFDNVFGFFVNTLAIRADLSGDPTFLEALGRVRNAVFAALDRQRVPFMRVVERIQPVRDASRSPVFQIMYAHQQSRFDDPACSELAAFALGEDGGRANLHGLEVESVHLERRSAQFDLLLMSALADRRLNLSLQFNTDLFERATAERMLGHFEQLLWAALTEPKRPISRLQLLTADERTQIEGWNDTARQFPDNGWIHEQISTRAAQTPDAIALSLDGATMTYRELDRRSNQLAHRLRAIDVGPGEFVGIAVERSFHLIVGLLGILKCGAAYVPLDPEYPRERLAYMLADAAPSVVLTLSHLLPDLPEGDHRCIVLDADPEGPTPDGDAPPQVEPTADDAAYMIYTSGSTGRPKGVVNTHGAIRNRLAWMQDAYRCGPADRVAQKTPAGFDVSVWEFFWPLMNGAVLVLARPGGHRDAAYLTELFTTEQITVAHFVPTMLQLFLAEPRAAECSSLRQVICSGEALTAELARRFTQVFPQCALDNLYGPTEAAVDVTSWRYRHDDRRDFVPIGHPIANVTIRLLDAHGNQVPVGVPGELHIGGVALARGYHNRPGLTAERFVPDPFSADPTARLYRTGDLARYHDDGGIEYLGRTDHQVKIHGNRIELGEIEAVLTAHPSVGDAAVIARGDGPGAQLVAYVTAAGDQRRPDHGELRTFVGCRLPQYMVPHAFVDLAALPVTPSGKVDRAALPAPTGAPRAAARGIPPRTPEEKVLGQVFGEILQIGEVGITDNFFELGGDSIRALQIRVRAREAGLDLAISDLLRYQTIEQLAKVAVAVPPGGVAEPIAPEPFTLIGRQDRERLPDTVVDAYPLAKLQEGLVFHSESSPDYEIYVMGFQLAGIFDEQAMRAALDLLAGRHPMLRTSYDFTAFSENLQMVHAEARIPLAVHDLGGLPVDAQTSAIEQFMRERKWSRFDWRRPPFLEVDVHLRSDRSFQITFSHPLFDGWSMALLITELMADYGALVAGGLPASRPGPRLAYRDFVALERQAIASTEHQRFWAEYLAGSERGEIPRWPSRRHQAPARHRRTTVKIDRDVTAGLRRLAGEVGTSLKSVALAAHLRVVSVLTGRQDITTGIIANGRPEELDGERVVGVFLNTIPLRMRFPGGTWRDLVRQTLAAEREVLPFRRFPLADLIRTLGEGESLFDTAFNYIHFHIYEALLQVEGIEVLGWSSPSDQTYFPLTAYFHSDITSGELLCFLDLDDAVFDPRQVEAVQEYYRAALTAMATDPDGRYENRSLLPAWERELQIGTSGHTLVPWPDDRPRGAHRRVSAVAASRPSATAVRTRTGTLTYGELETRSNQLAHHLHALGVKQGTAVGISLNREAELLIALIGVLKAGAAYVPMDPAFPRERLTHMAADSGAAVVITDVASAENLSQTEALTLLIDAEADSLASAPTGPPAASFDPDDLAYIIYTSGSTGVPKGVEISHRALDNLLLSFEREFAWSADEVLLAVTTLSFDIAGLELLLPLTTGALLELADDTETADPRRLAARIDRAGVTTMQATPATWRMLLDDGWAGSPRLRIVCGGEALTAELAEPLRPRGAELWNVYGPTETTIWSTAMRLEQIDGAPPIGHPLANTTCHVLDGHGQPVPIGAPGELHIAGAGLARGYRNRPELTAAAFVHHSLVPDGPPVRLYRTGDLARRRPDGALEYLSRLDTQVKVRGFRIELGEIEAVLGWNPALRQAVVVARGDGTGEARLVAYVVPHRGAEVDMRQLRAAVAEKLPSYMVPSVFLAMDEFPHTPNGKVDRKALPEPSGERPATGAAYAEPRTETEKHLARIWSDLLKVDRIGIDDAFFDLGGHSLLMVRMHSRIRGELTADVPLTALFEHPTIRRFAGFLTVRGDRDVPGEELRRIRARAQRRRARARQGTGPVPPAHDTTAQGSDL